MSRQRSKELNNDESIIAERLFEANLTDQGNAECLALLHGDKIRYCAEFGGWLLWDDVIWKPNSDHEARKLIVDTARQRRWAAALYDNRSKQDATLIHKQVNWALMSERRSIINNTLLAAADLPEFYTTISQYDANKYLLGLQNGVLNLKNGRFRQARQEDYLTMQAGVEYLEEATAVRWNRFLKEVFNDDKDLIRWIQKAVGYSLTGSTSEQILFMLLGKGANGKSVFLRVLKDLLGDYAATASFDTFDAKRRGDQTNDLARLRGKRLVTIIEAEEDRYLAEAKVKAVTGEDAITARFLHKEYFEFEPQFKIWLAMNHKPRIRGTDDGIWRRIRLIPFTRKFEGDSLDKDLHAKLRAEMPGILQWALEGLRMYNEEGLRDDVPAAIQKSTDEYRRESDVIGQWIDETISETPGAEITAKTLYDNYRDWMSERGLIPKSQPELGKELANRGFNAKRKNTGMVYTDIRLTEGARKGWSENVESLEEHRKKPRALRAVSR